MMKITLLTTSIACFAFGANAQVNNGLLKNHMGDFRLSTLKADTTISKLTLPAITGNFFTTPKIDLALLPVLNTNVTVVYSHMPVKHLQNTDNMPMALITPRGSELGVTLIKVIDPVK